MAVYLGERSLARSPNFPKDPKFPNLVLVREFSASRSLESIQYSTSLPAMPLPSLSLLLTAFVFLLFHPLKVTAAYNKEHRKECLEWYMKYGVEPGNTWGTIPDELQRYIFHQSSHRFLPSYTCFYSVWRANDCDSLLYAQEDEGKSC